LLAAATALALSPALTHSPASAADATGAASLAPAAASCIGSGTDTAINAALAGTGAQAVLCPGAVFELSNPITFTAPNQQLYTQGDPTGDTRAILRVASTSLATAVQGNNQPGVVVSDIEVDGNRPNLGLDSAGGALMEMGGGGTGQTVQYVYAHDTRSWSTLHFIEGAVTDSVPQCQNGKILDNEIGPAGNPGLPGVTGGWADGISMACGDTQVEGNTVTDATDGGIVVFGAPGSTISGNTIVARTQQLFGGINMVDYAPMNGNYTGTTVTGNTIDAAGALIKTGIAMGQQVWNCLTGTNYGATVTDNTLEGPYMGYGFPVDGVNGWTVSGNVDDSTHVGTQTAGGCFGSPAAAQPAPFQDENATGGSLQSQYVSATLDNLLGTLNGPAASEPAAPTMGVTASSVSFGNQTTGTSSAAKTVTVTDTGSTPVDVDNVQATGAFTETDNCGGTILNAGASCTVNVVFAPTSTGAQSGTLTIASLAANNPVKVSLSGTGTTSSGGGGTPTDLALNAQVSASSSTQNYTAANTVDGNTSTYWESTDGTWPATLTVDLGASDNLSSLIIDLPPSSAWQTRTQTLTVQGSTDNTTWITLTTSTTYTWNPTTGNTVTIDLPDGTTDQYIRLTFTANSVQNAAQVSELQIFNEEGVA
jgi:parallel beta-helix repeat protein